MVNWVLRGAVLLWALLFLIIGGSGFLDPMAYNEQFKIVVEGVAVNTLRADLSAFFLVSSASAAIGALMPGWTRALFVPAALYGTALAGRLFGAASGDIVDGSIIQAMIIEALSTGLMLGSWWVLSRPASAAAGESADTQH
ncbi:hypothetical protein [Sphingopyxis sp.]|uniref:hypothetical protein n=1 Tax=Sphingopyxis sp. TaxID=1908224 RepID=UPI003D130037